MDCFNKDVLFNVFSYLDCSELCKMSLVSTEWHEVQKYNEIWKQLSLKSRDDSQLHHENWKEQFKIIHNWKTGHATLSKLQSSEHSQQITLIGNTPHEIVHNPEDSLFYFRNCINGDEKKFDLQKSQTDIIKASTFNGPYWIALDALGKILIFDIQKMEKTLEIAPNEKIQDRKDIRFPSICSSENDIFSFYNFTLARYDLKTGELKAKVISKKNYTNSDLNRAMLFSEDLLRIKCTSKHIYAEIYDSDFNIINFYDKSSLEFIDQYKLSNNFSMYSVENSGNTIILLREKIRFSQIIFEFLEIKENKLVSLRKIDILKQDLINCSIHCIFKNWVIMENENSGLRDKQNIDVIDLMTGQIINSIEKKDWLMTGLCNDSVLFLSNYETTDYSFIDFTRPEKKINLLDKVEATVTETELPSTNLICTIL